MNTGKLSRRRLLSGFLAALAAWLCPRWRCAAAAPHRSVQTADLPPKPCVYRATYTYDGMGRLINVAHYPSCPIEPLPHSVHVTREQGGTFISYDCAGQGEQGTGMAR